jgi:hypothetical protein
VAANGLPHQLAAGHAAPVREKDIVHRRLAHADVHQRDDLLDRRPRSNVLNLSKFIKTKNTWISRFHERRPAAHRYFTLGNLVNYQTWP